MSTARAGSLPAIVRCMIALDDITAAHQRVARHVHRTPTVRSTTLSERSGTNVYLKLELFQKTGSFKPRGAFNQLLVAMEATGAGSFVGASGGNFAQGLAYAGTELGVATTVVMPQSTPANYVEATRGYGASVELTPDIAATFDRVDELASAGLARVHPFDDPAMMAGDGTLGLELVEDVPGLTDVFISVGGGGLITGVGSAVHALRPEARIWAVETEGAQVLHDSLVAGRPLTMTPTSLARTLGSPYLASTAYAFAVDHVEAALVVTDAAAYDSMVFLLERAKVLAELAAACTLAAFEQQAGHFGPADHVALVLCGGNVSVQDLGRYADLLGAGGESRPA